MEFLTQLFDNTSPAQFAVVGASVLFVWFLPAMVAMMFNRKQVKLIALACIPAGFSMIAWGGVMVWAFTGNMVNRFNKKPATQD
jgi:hypothetical protein